MARNRFRQLALVVMLYGLCPPALLGNFIWNADLGSAITASTFDTYSGVVAESLDFNFPFEGSNYTGTDSLYVSEAGFVWLGGHNVAENTGVGSLSQAEQLFNQGSPRVAAAWYDLDPDNGGTVYFNQTSSEAIITWVAVPSDSSGSNTATFQMQLFDTGVVIFSYELLDSDSLGSDPSLVIGLTEGGGTSAASVDLTGALATQLQEAVPQDFYDYLSPSFSIVDESITFTPSGSVFQVNETPEPATLVPCAGFLVLLYLSVKRKCARRY